MRYVVKFMTIKAFCLNLLSLTKRNKNNKFFNLKIIKTFKYMWYYINEFKNLFK